MSSTSKKSTLAKTTRLQNVVPFPLERCRDLILNTARGMLPRGHRRGARNPTRGQKRGARKPTASGERTLAATLKRQRETMEKRGIASNKIAIELAAFERVVRCEHARMRGNRHE
jgi:hypothetical protein